MHRMIHLGRLTNSPRARLIAAAALVSGILVAGCGGGSHSPMVAANVRTTSSTSSVASTGHATTSRSSSATDDGAGGSGPATPTDLQTTALAYSRCMRANGVPKFPDPSSGGGFVFSAGSGIDPSSPLFQAASAKCRKLMPGGGPPGPGTQSHPSAQALAQMVKVAECMRRHGVPDFPDPRTSVPSHPFPGGGAGVISDIDGVILLFPASIDRQSPAFTRAAAACKFPLHNH
jgi:hypothetical protein